MPSKNSTTPNVLLTFCSSKAIYSLRRVVLPPLFLGPNLQGNLTQVKDDPNETSA